MVPVVPVVRSVAADVAAEGQPAREPDAAPPRSIGSGDGGVVRVSPPERFWRGFVPQVRNIWSYRELLVNLTHKELRVKYKGSALGFVWSLVRPLMLLVIYWIVFGKFLKAGLPNFAFYLFSGLIAWDFFSSSVVAATSSVVSNSSLVKKVYFPREIFPLAAVGAGVVHFAIQVGVFIAVLVVFRYPFWGPNLLFLPLAFVAMVALAASIGLLLSAWNVYLRDIQHLIEVFLQFWFFMTPIVYPINFALSALAKRSIGPLTLDQVYLMNPMADVVMGFQRAFYRFVTVTGPSGRKVVALYPGSWQAYTGRLLGVLGASLFLLWVAQRVFAKLQGNFAQEL